VVVRREGRDNWYSVGQCGKVDHVDITHKLVC